MQDRARKTSFRVLDTSAEVPCKTVPIKYNPESVYVFMAVTCPYRNMPGQ
jgi:hypothetical protein